jgi:hypothetical protein
MEFFSLFIALLSVACVASEPFGTCSPKENPQQPTFLPDSSDCSKYYICAFGKAYLRMCPAGQEWKLDGSYCDHPVYAKCVRPINPHITTTIKPTTTTPSTPNKPIGVCPKNEDPTMPTHLSDAVNCSKFYKCDNGVPKVFFCPATLEWNKDLFICDYPENVICKNR